MIRKLFFLTVITIPFYIIFCDFSYNYFDIVLPVFVPILLEIVIVIATIIYLFVQADLEKKKIIASYARYISPEVAKEVVNNATLVDKNFYIVGLKLGDQYSYEPVASAAMPHLLNTHTGAELIN